MPGPTVLVVDDDPAVKEAVSEALRREGCHLMFAENGSEALMVLRDAGPTIVILDLRMPTMGGLEFLSQVDLKTSADHSVIVLTAFADADSVRACYEAGVSALVKKPFAFDELRGALKIVFANRELLRLLHQTLLEKVASGMVEEEINQRIEEVGKHLQQLAELLKELRKTDHDALISRIKELPDLPETPGARR